MLLPAFVPLYLAPVRLHLEYAIPACSLNLMADLNHLEKFKDWLHNWYLAFVIFLTKRDCSGWAFKPYNGDDFGLN